MGDLITSVESIQELIEGSPVILLYISKDGCNVCRELKPKIIKLLDGHFPEMRFQYVDIERIKDAAGKFSVFAVPTILVFFDGKEFFREGRNLGIEQLREKIEKPYSMLF